MSFNHIIETALAGVDRYPIVSGLAAVFYGVVFLAFVWPTCRRYLSGALALPPPTSQVSFAPLDAMRGLIEAVRLVPENGALRIELYGELAALLALGNNKPKTHKNRHLQGISSEVQVTMVAGARLPLFRTLVSTFIPIQL